MKRTPGLWTVGLVLAVLLVAVTATPVAAQGAAPARVVLPTDRTVLPIPRAAASFSTAAALCAGARWL